MASFQKQPDKFLLPFKNLNEFEQLKKLIYSSSKEKQEEALQRLVAMKHRTALFPAGMEGTLILLQAMLSSSSEISNTEIKYLYSAAVLRFLNICDGIRKKQGTFYETAKLNKFPSWIISLRHDIAHGHNIPSKNKLGLAISTLFQFMKEKYWDIQELYIKDCTTRNDKDDIEGIFYCYGDFLVNLFYNKNVDSLTNQLKQLLSCVVKKVWKIKNPNQLKECADKLMEQSGSTLQHYALEISEHLVSDKLMLLTKLIFVDNKKKIPPKFLSLWEKYLSLLYENNVLMVLVNKLFDCTCDVKVEDEYKEVASYWIQEIFLSLQLTKKVKENYDNIDKIHSTKLAFKKEIEYNEQYSKVIIFLDVTKLSYQEAVKFEDKILCNPNRFVTIFLDSVLTFNENSNKVVKNVLNKMENLYSNKNLLLSDKIKRIPDLLYEENEPVCLGKKRKLPEQNKPAVNKFKRYAGVEPLKSALGVHL